MQESIHQPVLLHEIVRSLIAGRDFGKGTSVPWYLDGTLGGAGHAQALAEALDGHVNIIGLDRDLRAIERAQEKLSGKVTKLILAVEDYRNLDRILDANHIDSIDMMLLDLGISSDELDSSGKGFTFQRDEPLYMTFGDPLTYEFTARDIVNGWDEDVIANIIFGYGEERFARRIARAIVHYRLKKKIETSSELAEIVRSSVPAFYRHGKINPATKTFQALRIAVNDELNALRQGLEKGFGRITSGGRLAVISFHSLEDRIVKEFFKNHAEKGATLISKKPITASAEEILHNPRARSAKLRIIEKN